MGSIIFFWFYNLNRNISTLNKHGLFFLVPFIMEATTHLQRVLLFAEVLRFITFAMETICYATWYYVFTTFRGTLVKFEGKRSE